jgi:uncharacterized protein with gpF-like domain
LLHGSSSLIATDQICEIGNGFFGSHVYDLETVGGWYCSGQILISNCSYNGARSAIFSDPVVREARPYLQFHAVEDSRTSDICEALDGKVLPADDPFWQRHTPPLHHNCRSVLVPLSHEEAHDEGITSGKPDTGGAAPDEGFGRPSAPGDGEPDLAGFDPDIRRALEKRLE